MQLVVGNTLKGLEFQAKSPLIKTGDTKLNI